ncbi:MAG TPA: alanine racemase [Candidatus Desulfaltia sp.]|nr:alanine racemase [Candidatus Desulfaltia sp.]
MKRRNFLKTLGGGSLAALSSPGAADRFAGRQEKNAGGSAPLTVSGHRDPRIEVNLDHIVWNLAQLKKRVKVSVMGVVKANAYGHGLVGVAKALEAAGVEALMVGKLREAVALREAGIKCPILNFGPFDRHDSDEIVGRNISQSVFTEDAAYLDETAARLKRTAPVHIDIDTGMGRTGVLHDRALPLIEKIASFPHLRIEGVCTTLTEDPEFDKEQLRRFLDICSAANKRGISLGWRHAASSAAVFYSSDFYLDMIRPGITLYGYYPNARTRKEDALSLRPALKFSAAVIFIKDLSPGESLSYLRVFKAGKKMRAATLGVGYSDGYPFLFGGKVSVMIRDKKFQVLEAVTSNHVMVDLGDDREVRIGDEAVLIHPDKGPGLTADALAERSGVPDYKILIGLSPLTQRAYSEARLSS